MQQDPRAAQELEVQAPLKVGVLGVMEGRIWEDWLQVGTRSTLEPGNPAPLWKLAHCFSFTQAGAWVSTFWRVAAEELRSGQPCEQQGKHWKSAH